VKFDNKTKYNTEDISRIVHFVREEVKHSGFDVRRHPGDMLVAYYHPSPELERVFNLDCGYPGLFVNLTPGKPRIGLMRFSHVLDRLPVVEAIACAGAGEAPSGMIEQLIVKTLHLSYPFSEIRRYAWVDPDVRNLAKHIIQQQNFRLRYSPTPGWD
jgi:hypothetical protein